jgi:hypothetical protein
MLMCMCAMHFTTDAICGMPETQVLASLSSARDFLDAASCNGAAVACRQ